MDGKSFKDWMINAGKAANTASNYLTGVNIVSRHCRKDVLKITDVSELRRLYALYGPKGVHADVGTSNSSNVHNGLKQWLDYQVFLAQKGAAVPSVVAGASIVGPALNQILYGPPGTGKTYATIEAALEILDPHWLTAHSGNRSALKERFDELAQNGQIRFVTFHQSFSYEDFVEGLRAESNEEEKQLEYNVEPGVFKRLCDAARTQSVQAESGIRSNPRIWKISINGTGNSPTKTYCLEHGEARVGWGATGDLQLSLEQSAYYQRLGSGDKGTLEYFAQQMVIGDILLCIHSAEQIGAVGVVTSDYRYEETVPAGVIGNYQHVRSVKWLYLDVKQSILPLNDDHQFTLKTVYPMARFGWADLLSYLEKQGVTPVVPLVVDKTERKPHVLIIDEINRGNVSRIFGELITLIETSKREGAEEALSIDLPYSKKPFSVPSNVYLIGTMNTADRSLAGLDIALRRRFVFREMPPKPELLDLVLVDGVNIGQLLRVMNQRIEALLDRDHTLGHAYFMPLRDDPRLERLSLIFRNQILPLLQEYFFEDWRRIQWVMNDHRKAAHDCFVYEQDNALQSLFGDGVSIGQGAKTWCINDEAFDRIEAYSGVIDHQGESQVSAVAREATHGEFNIREMNSGSIEVWRNGIRESTSKPALRAVAAALDVNTFNGQGNELNTRSLGRSLLSALETVRS
ncbi:AAA family ATPase [Pseudomonas chlororaphis]|uniref:AAA family ATPase n=1 Tax=Pseudomonas chlororaphis TaxID=587753 RepID=UPI001EEE5550|nr:AAA family ATPase [Pseudomonas chlororaphis]